MFWVQLKALIRKQYIVKMRHKKNTFFEFLLPLLFGAIIGLSS